MKAKLQLWWKIAYRILSGILSDSFINYKTPDRELATYVGTVYMTKKTELNVNVIWESDRFKCGGRNEM